MTTIMKPDKFLVAVLAALAFTSQAADPRDAVTQSAPRTASLLIDVASRIFYGVPVGTSEDAFIAQNGRPAGYIRLNGEETFLLYAADVGFLFRNSKLSGLVVSDNLVDWEMSKRLRTNSPFDGVRWRLENGLRIGTSRAEARNILGARLEGDSYNSSYSQGDFRVHLSFSRIAGPESEQNFKLRGIRIESGK
jgi:hypothetical protein